MICDEQRFLHVFNSESFANVIFGVGYICMWLFSATILIKILL